MTVVINQPYFLPYIGLMDKIQRADVAVINDYAPLSLCRETHRRVKVLLDPKIKSTRVLTEWVSHEDEGKLFKDIKLNDDFYKRIEEIVRGLERTYAKAKGYHYLAEDLYKVMRAPAQSLGDYNFKIICLLLEKLKIKTNTVLLSRQQFYNSDPIKDTNHPTGEIYKVCQLMGTNKYLSGVNGINFMDNKYLLDHGIGIIQHSLDYKPYPQFEGEFIKCLSTVDLIFNNGEDSYKYIGQSSKFI